MDKEGDKKIPSWINIIEGLGIRFSLGEKFTCLESRKRRYS